MSATPSSYTFTVLGTTDLHGHVLNWDYVANTAHEGELAVGLAKVSTVVDEVRTARGRANTLLLDAGDTIQGSELADHFARVEPITGPNAPVHPMAAAMNALGYDAAVLGNHDFNHGLPLLRAFQRQCAFPLLGANVLDARTGRPAFPPYLLTRVGPGVTVGVLGLTTPGTAVWDRAHVEGALTFDGLPEQAAAWVPRLRAAGADVVVVAAHSGADGASSYGRRLPHAEHAAALVAERVPGVDAVLVGHAHLEIPERRVRNAATGREVVLSEPLYWGKRVSRFDIEVTRDGTRNGSRNATGEDDGWRVASVTATLLDATRAAEDPAVLRLVEEPHRRVLARVNQVIGRATAAMTAAEAPHRDVPLVRLLNHVQSQAVRRALAGTPHAGLPVLSQAACVSRTAGLPAGPITLRDVAGMYPYEGRLEARLVTGAQLRDYLEHSARYFVRSPDLSRPAELTNADGTPDYHFDAVSGVSYVIDPSRAPGSRVTALRHPATDRGVADDAVFVLAVNEYRAAGGGDFPHVPDAPRLWAGTEQIRALLVAWIRRAGVVDPAALMAEPGSGAWRLAVAADAAPPTAGATTSGAALSRPSP
ncbi:bifunctional metallophosphatase/5'-nucleotidase [Streptomyces sp. 4N509B]|uniref:bifunctional metallophosphatase/5'-nucleotidase n=1 Tax=Streptomyces sp. 4N509B TaxID=3457413 RepID=UPI003FD35C7E